MQAAPLARAFKLEISTALHFSGMMIEGINLCSERTNIVS